MIVYIIFVRPKEELNNEGRMAEINKNQERGIKCPF